MATQDALGRVEQEHRAFRARLIADGVLLDTGLDGSYLHSEGFEQVIAGVQSLVTRAARPDGPATWLRVPSVMPRSLLLQTSYLTAFPQLVGSVHTFRGAHRAHAELVAASTSGEDWGAHLVTTEAVLCPATCHQVYPLCASGLPPEGRRFDVVGQCFRAEPSLDPARMISFRMHEQVIVGSAEQAQEHRNRWVDRAAELLGSLGLSVHAAPANDPFFGRLSSILAAGQRSKELKVEILGRVSSSEQPTALVSANLHEDHFGTIFGLTLPDGSTAHTACVGFGLERVALALVAAHGSDTGAWPPDVRSLLELAA